MAIFDVAPRGSERGVAKAQDLKGSLISISALIPVGNCDFKHAGGRFFRDGPYKFGGTREDMLHCLTRSAIGKAIGVDMAFQMRPDWTLYVTKPVSDIDSGRGLNPYRDGTRHMAELIGTIGLMISGKTPEEQEAITTQLAQEAEALSLSNATRQK